MSRPFSRLIPAALAAVGIFAATSLRAAERAFPAIRHAAVERCQIVEPTFELSISAPPKLDPVRFPGGARRFQPVAAPCPVRTDAIGV